MKTHAKVSILIFAVIIFFAASVKAATVIGETISTTGLTVIGSSIFEGISRFSHSLLVTNQIGDEGASLKVDGTYATTSVATIQTVGTTSRLMLVSGESLWPTTWSLGINTGLETEPNQDFQIRQVSNGTGPVDVARLTILKSNGRVGIGTTTPQYNLSVDGSVFATNSFRVGDGNEFVSTSYPNGLGFWTNGNPRMTLDSAGLLGIGTTTPQYKLDVNGDINIAGGSGFKINGVTTLKADTVLDNLFVGNNSGFSAISLTIGGNTFLGGNSGYSCNGSSCGGNTFLGSGAGYNLATGGNNSFIGYNSGGNMLDGYQNIFIGTTAGWSNTSGHGNVFLGFGSGYYETGSDKLYISNNSEGHDLIYGDFSTGSMGLGGLSASSSPSIFISSDGSVGIGTTSPESNFHVYGGDVATSTIQVGGEESSNGSCLKLRDRDGAGWTYCTTLDGVFECSITPCS